MTKPRPSGEGEASEAVVLAGVDTQNPTLSPVQLQTLRICERFCLPLATAQATAALAFGQGRA